MKDASTIPRVPDLTRLHLFVRPSPVNCTMDKQASIGNHESPVVVAFSMFAKLAFHHTRLRQ